MAGDTIQGRPGSDRSWLSPLIRVCTIISKNGVWLYPHVYFAFVVGVLLYHYSSAWMLCMSAETIQCRPGPDRSWWSPLIRVCFLYSSAIILNRDLQGGNTYNYLLKIQISLLKSRNLTLVCWYWKKSWFATVFSSLPFLTVFHIYPDIILKP